MKLNIIYLISVCILFACCSDSSSPEKSEIIYATSFEKTEDLNDWYGLSENNIQFDAPPNCGEKSILVMGGCVVPHCVFKTNINQDPGDYFIECWGKALPNSYGGVVILKINDGYPDSNNSVSIYFGDSVWTQKASDTIYLPDSNPLIVEMISGGFIPAGMLIDELQIKKVL